MNDNDFKIDSQEVKCPKCGLVWVSALSSESAKCAVCGTDIDPHLCAVATEEEIN